MTLEERIKCWVGYDGFDITNSLINDLIADRSKLIDSIQWILNDVSYKAPEQWKNVVTERWIEKLKQTMEEKQQ